MHGICEEQAVLPKQKTITEQVSDYLQYCSVEQGLAEGTIKASKKILEGLAAFFRARNVEIIGEVNRSLVREYLAETLKNAPSNDFKCKIISTLRIFGKFLARECAWDDYHLFSEIESPKRQHKIPEVLTEEQIARIIEQPMIASVRDWALLETLYATGCRVDEICDIRFQDVKFDAGTAVVRGKGKKERIVFIHEKAKMAILLLRRLLHHVQPSPDTFIFPNLNDPKKRLRKETVAGIIRKHANGAGVMKRVYPHLFRHSFATHLLENGANIMEVKEMLGHADVSTTQIYTHISQQKIMSDYNKLFGPAYGQEYWDAKAKELKRYTRILDYALRKIRKSPLFTEERHQELVDRADFMKRFIKKAQLKQVR